MTKKIIILIFISILFNCSTSKKAINKNSSKENIEKNEISKIDISIYSGIKAIDDTYLKNPNSVAVYKNGLVVADMGNNLIKQIKNKEISNYAGSGKSENTDGTLLNSSLNIPGDIVIDKNNNIYTVVGYDQISKIDSNGMVSLYAGKYTPGWIDGGIDGPKETASFKFISALKFDSHGNMYVADKHKIRKIKKDGNVETISGNNESGDEIGKPNEARYNQIADITISKTGEIYIIDQVNKKIKKIDSNNIVSNFVEKSNLTWPVSIEINNEGDIIVFDSSSKKLYIYDDKGELINVINNNILKAENYNFLAKITIDKYDNIIIPSKDFINILDTNYNIKQIGRKNGYKQNGKIKEATFNIPYDGVFDKLGNLYVLDKGNYLIRKISKKGIVTTYSGSNNYGHGDGDSNTCTFKTLQSIAINNNDLYILDGDWKDTKVRKIDYQGRTTTYINPKNQKIKWERPCDIIFDSKNNMYISDSRANKIYKIDEFKNVEEYITPSHINLKNPHGLEIDKNDNLFICDSYNNRIIKVSKEKQIESLKINNIQFDEPENLAFDDKNNLYVSDKNRTRIIKITNEKDSEIILKESVLGTNKKKKFSEYYNSLKLSTFKNSLFVFDKYNHQIIKLTKKN